METRIVQCVRCGLLYANPFPFPLEPQKLYGDPAKYFETVDEDIKVVNCHEIVRRSQRHAKRNIGSLLDVGSGRGEMLVAAHRLGIPRVIGLEFAPAMIEYVKTKYGLPVLLSSVEDHAEASPEPYDMIVLSAVLEHVYDPDRMMAACARLAAPGAVLYIDVPNESSLLAAMGNTFHRLRRDPAVFNLSPTWPPYHVYGFSPPSLRVLLEKHGFEVVDTFIWADPKIPHRPGDLRDRARAFVGTQINRLANAIGRASNFATWARKR